MRRLSSGRYSSPVSWLQITSIVIDPTDTQTLYAADFGGGEYMSTDGGTSWNEINQGLTMRACTRMAVSAGGKIVYTGTKGGRVYRLVLVNQPPVIFLTIPDTQDTISLLLGDSLNFTVYAYDLNGDTLIYSWYLDGQVIPGADSLSHLLTTDSLDPGYHSLAAEVSDGDSAAPALWHIEMGGIGIEQRLSAPPLAHFLKANYPDPCTHETVVEYGVPADTHVSLKIYNV
ncbi:MAG: WD40/YVTN/BNR-like repeat-containing protein, partial [bacterium]